jgi:hypothetical protein
MGSTVAAVVFCFAAEWLLSLAFGVVNAHAATRQTLAFAGTGDGDGDGEGDGSGGCTETIESNYEDGGNNDGYCYHCGLECQFLSRGATGGSLGCRTDVHRCGGETTYESCSDSGWHGCDRLPDGDGGCWTNDAWGNRIACDDYITSCNGDCPHS